VTKLKEYNAHEQILLGIRPPGALTSIHPCQHPRDEQPALSRPPRERHDRTEAPQTRATAPDRERASHQAPPHSRAVARGPSWNRLRGGTGHCGTGGRGLHVTRCTERLPSTTSTCLLRDRRTSNGRLFMEEDVESRHRSPGVEERFYVGHVLVRTLYRCHSPQERRYNRPDGIPH